MNIIDRELVENGDHTVILEFPDIVFGTNDISYGDNYLGGRMTFEINKSDDGIFLETGTDNCTLSWIPDFGIADNQIALGTFLKLPNIEPLPPDYAYTINKDFAVGTIQGNHSVSPDGSFSYNIPIEIAPGTNGVQPSLSLNYNSNMGEGIAGYGWGISAGQDYISRSPKIFNLDGENADIRFDNADKLILGNTKLVLKSGIYGVMGSIYVPENGGDYTSIELLVTNLCWADTKFKATMLDGTVIEYGSTIDSRRTTNGKVLKWAIKRVIDPNGNFYEYNYINQGNVHLLSNIKYTGHLQKTDFNSYSSIDANTYAEIKFTYKNRSDIPPIYEQNYCGQNTDKLIQKNEILDKIQLFVNDEIYKEYKLSYENQNYLYLKKIELIGKNNAQYNATVFNYNNDSYSSSLQLNNIPIVPDENIPNISPGYERYTLFGDYNGDGFLDRVFVDIDKTIRNKGEHNTTTWYLQIGKKFNGTQIEYEAVKKCTSIVLDGNNQADNIENGSDHAVDIENAIISDIDNDGRDDIIFSRARDEGTNAYYKMYLDIYHIKFDANSGELIKEPTPLVSNILIRDGSPTRSTFPRDFNLTNNNLVLGDYDGDGFPELMLTSLFHQTESGDATMVYYFDIMDKEGNINSTIDYSTPINDTFYYLNQPTLGYGSNFYSRCIQLGTFDRKSSLIFNGPDCYPSSKRYFRENHPYGGINHHSLDSINLINNNSVDFIFEEDSYSGDFNGDGYTDYFNATESKINYWNGEQFNKTDIASVDSKDYPFAENGQSSNCERCYYVADIDGDNKDDIIQYNIYTRFVGLTPVCDYEYIICMPKGFGYAKYYKTRINSGSNNYSNFLIGEPTFCESINKFTLSEDVNNVGNYIYNKSCFHSVSLSNKFDLASQGRGGLYVNGKYITFFSSNDNHKMSEIFDGLGNKLEVKYNNINDETTYAKGSDVYVKDNNNPNTDVTQLRYCNYGIEVVNSVKSIQATDLTVNNEITYQYKGAVYDRLIKGFLGFENFKSTMLNVVNTMNTTTTTLNLTNETLQKYFKVKSVEPTKSARYVLMPMKTKTNRLDSPEKSGSTMDFTYQRKDINLLSQNWIYFIYASQIIDTNFNLKTSNLVNNEYDNKHQLTSKTSQIWNVDLANTEMVAQDIESYFYDVLSTDYISKISRYTIDKLHKDDLTNPHYTRRTDYLYYGYGDFYTNYLQTESDKGYNLKTIIYDPDDNTKTGYSNHQDFVYDKFGNVKVSEQSDPASIYAQHPNHSMTNYDDIGRFPTELYDIYGYKSLININKFGQKVSETDIQGNTIEYEYNDLGNLYKTIYPNNVTDEVFWEWCYSSSNDPAIKTNIFPLYKIHNLITKTNGDTTNTFSYYDSWGREVISKSRYMDSYDGSTPVYKSVANATVYYPIGLINTEYGIYDPTINSLNGTLPLNKNVATYDNQGRVDSTKTDFGGISYFNGFTYNNKTITETYDGPDGIVSNRRHTDKTINATGDFESKTDASDKTVDATYYNNGQIHVINGVSKEYDAIGRKTKMIDPDAGTIEYKYNVYGDLKEEVHNKISKTEYTYDGSRRLTQIIIYKYNSANSQYNIEEATTNYQYYELVNNTIVNGLGQIKQAEYNYSLSGRLNVDQTVKFFYDSKGLLIDKEERIDETGKTTLVFKTKFEYDNFGKLEYRTLPSDPINGNYGLKLKYTYNKFDEIIKIEKYNGAGYDNIWRLAEQNIFGNPKTIDLGSSANNLKTNFGYNNQQMLTTKTTTCGSNNTIKEKWILGWDIYRENLSSRECTYNSEPGYLEEYEYDFSDRLHLSTYYDRDDANDIVNYDEMDIRKGINKDTINSKAKAGTYEFYYHDGFQYQDKGASKNAVKRIETTVPWDPMQVSDIKPNHQILTYTSFNSVETITEIYNRGTTSLPDLYPVTKEFYYGYDGQRILMISKVDGVELSRKYYNGEFEYTVEPSPSTKKEVTFISTPTGLAAANVKKTGETEKFYYILTDQLGSITQLLDENNVSQGKFTYDAWGRLRDISKGVDMYIIGAPQAIAFHILDRGYTGHEHLLDHDIINMNGRIYDPVVGQFMQADNYIQSPEDYIDYNRYAYCLYNPFKYTDPSGEEPVLITINGELWGAKMGQQVDCIALRIAQPSMSSLPTMCYTSSLNTLPMNYNHRDINYDVSDESSPARCGSSNGKGGGRRRSSSSNNAGVYNGFTGDAAPKNNQSNPSTQERNFMWTNYIGWMDAKKYDGSQDFSIAPVNMADYYARIHDLEYTNIGYWSQKRTGRLGFLIDTRTIAADYKFTRDELKVALSLKKVPIYVRFTAAVSAYIIGGCAIPKTLLQMMKPYSINEIIMYNNIGKTPIPKKRKK